MSQTTLDYVRIALYALLALIGFSLFQAWEQDHPKTILPVTQVENMPAGRYVPQAPDSATSQAVAAPAQATPALPPAEVGKRVYVTTDLLQVGIDTLGGDIVEVKLLAYPEALNSSSPFVLLNDDEKNRYIAESGLLSDRGPDTTQAQALYSTLQTDYTLSPDQKTVVVNLHWQARDGLQVNKTFTFTRGSYEVNVTYDIKNQSTQAWSGRLYSQLMRTDNPPPNNSGFMNLATYFGAAISSPQKPFEKITFKQMQEKSLNQTIQGGWAAMIQHYFISAWIPAKSATSTYYTKVLPNGLNAVGMIGEPISVAPGANVTTTATLYAGPAIANQLEKASPDLKLTIDYGWFWFISVIIFWMMDNIYNLIGNWGWSIVLVTIIIKIAFYQLSNKSYRSMSGLKKLQPRIEMLKERYKDDKQKLTQATMELYKEAKVNPMSGCLPILIQIPVFIALYWVLVESVQLRQAPFILWIHDLSQHDPYYVLPLLMGISMFLQQRLNPPPPDPMQAKIMMAMPVIFTFLFANFPAGLMLYWFVNNSLSFLQQWHIMHRLEKESNGASSSRAKRGDP